MKVGRFIPPAIHPQPLDDEALARFTGRRWTYAASGKAAIYHCLRAYSVSAAVVVPVYACASILAPLRALGLEPVFADIDPDDLNLSFEAFVAIASRRRIGAVIVPSLYGNPARLDCFEGFCREHGIVMIDDAAQSFGARLGDRLVGTFGDAGLFSFSPGKATAGHGGGFFWTHRPYTFARSAHPLAHRVKWWNFYWSRLRAYDTRAYRRMLGPLGLLAGRLDREALWHDRMERFEGPILGGILEALFAGRYSFRMKWAERFGALAADAGGLRPVQTVRGVAHPHKFVLVADQPRRAHDLAAFLAVNGIFSAPGYRPLAAEGDFPALRLIDGRVVELAIDENPERMQCQFEAMQKFIVLEAS